MRRRERERDVIMRNNCKDKEVDTQTMVSNCFEFLPLPQTRVQQREATKRSSRIWKCSRHSNVYKQSGNLTL